MAVQDRNTSTTIQDRIATQLERATQRLEDISEHADLGDLSIATSAVRDLAEALQHCGVVPVTVTAAALDRDQALELAHDIERVAEWLEAHVAVVGQPPVGSSRLWSHVMALRGGRLGAL